MSKKKLFIALSVFVLIATAVALAFFPRKQLVGESLQVQILEHLYKPLDLVFIYLAFSPNRLPAYEITTTQNDLLRLYDTLPQTKDKEEIRQKRFLTDRIYIPATIKFEGREFSARLTVQGGIPRHYLGEKKSFRVRIDKNQDEPFSGINFIIPEDDNFIDTHVSYFLAQKLNLFMPKPGFANLRLNGVNLGVYETLYDDQDNSVLELGQLSTNNPVLREEIKPQYIAQGTLSNLFNQTGSWKLTNKPETDDPAPLSAIEKLKEANLLQGDQFYRTIPQIIDVDQFLRFLAHNFLMGDFHQSNDANQVLILVKEKGRLWFVPDENTINPIEVLQDLHYNDFFEKILSDPPNFWRRNQVLWSLLEDPNLAPELQQYSDDLYNMIKGPIYQDEKKAFRFIPFRSNVKKQTRTILDNLKKVKNYFDQYYIESFVKNTPDSTSGEIATIRTQVNSFFAPKLKSIDFKFKDKTRATIRLYLDASGNETQDSGDELITTFTTDGSQTYSVQIDQYLKFQKFLDKPFDRVKPTAVSTLLLTSDQKVAFGSISLNFSNSLTGQDLESVTHMIDGSFFASLPPLPAFVRQTKDSFVIGPGVFTVNDDLIIGEGQLEIRPGTTLLLAPKKSIISLAQVTARGTPALPITITAQDKSNNWGSFLVIGPHQSQNEFDYTRVEYGSGINNYGYLATGALAIHFADATISNSYFAYNTDDDGLNVKHAKATVIFSRFENNRSDHIDFDSVKDGFVSNNIFIVDSKTSNNGDGIDTSFSRVTIKDNQILGSRDKCLSIGENSDVAIENNLLSQCDMGIAVKDGSKATISGNVLRKNRLAIAAYLKKFIYPSGGEINLGTNTFEGNIKEQEIDKNSKVLVLQ